MALLVDTIYSEMETLNKNHIRLKAIGDLSGLPDSTRKALLDGIEKTKGNSRMTLVLALNYSSRWEIVEATRKIAEKVEKGDLAVNEIDASVFAQHLTTSMIPDPELLIRTSGEYRMSNYLLWQAAYAELYFTEVLWPDFRKEDFYEAVLAYQQRERRFGKTSEQLVTP
jgi:undecaprenyl diphosphate synthase